MSTEKVYTVGVLTSGGDAPGMNAAIRSVVRTALSYGFKVVGIRNGYDGILKKDFSQLNIRSVSNIINRGGTFLYTARCKEMLTKNGLELAVSNLKDKKIDALIAIGGDGTFKGLLELSKYGINCIGIPGTIDNDIACSEYTIGYDTAMNTAMQMVDKLRDTAHSHHRCSIVEVMGRKKGYIALNTGIACGATSILIPELEVDINKDVIEKIKKSKELGRKHFIIIVAEGVDLTNAVYESVKKYLDIDTRLTVLGHVQRGGSPTMLDRLMAAKLGFYAVELLKNNKKSRIVAVKNNNVIDLDIEKALSEDKKINLDDIIVAENLSI